MKYQIYVLIDPRDLKVRYIGLTCTSLKRRLATHLSKAKNNYFNYQKDNWVRSLLLHNCKPIIRRLQYVDTLIEGRKQERFLITKYRNRLFNINDTGRNGKNTVVSEERKRTISKTLKEKYKKGLGNVARKEIYVYNLNGRYLFSFPSGMIASKSLGINYSAIYKCTSGLSVQYAGYQFSTEKVERMKDNFKNVKLIKDTSVQDFCRLPQK